MRCKVGGYEQYIWCLCGEASRASPAGADLTSYQVESRIRIGKTHFLPWISHSARRPNHVRTGWKVGAGRAYIEMSHSHLWCFTQGLGRSSNNDSRDWETRFTRANGAEFLPHNHGRITRGPWATRKYIEADNMADVNLTNNMLKMMH